MIATKRKEKSTIHDRAVNRGVFTYLTGQYDNLGDALLRRAMIAELGEAGTWHIYLGHAPRDYQDSLHIPADAIVYTSLRVWILRAMKSLMQPRSSIFISNPGEISSSRHELIAGCISLLLIASSKIGRNATYRLGLGARDRKRPWSLPHELCTRWATLSYWRDARSAEMYGSGLVAPDWAFALPPHSTDEKRDYVALSYRGDKPLPELSILLEVKRWATDRGLELVFVSQVRRDVESNELLATKLGVRHHGRAAMSLADYESSARAIYAKSALVISNRIHVLIAGLVDGASPAAILAHDDVKVARTLSAGGVDSRIVVTDLQPEAVAPFLESMLGHDTRALASIVDGARSRIRALVSEVQGEIA